MKKGFTLIEILISIILFSIILIFLYEVLNSTQNHNKKYATQIEKFDSKYDTQFVLLEDILNLQKSLLLDVDRDENNILVFNTSNTFHNPFFTNVIYLVNRKNELLRIETNKKFNKDKIYSLLESSYIDIVAKDIKKFKIIKETKRIFFYVEFTNDEKNIFSFNMK
jgi:prepilin-type N-terminal cleavage/methylation domain-containing protein